MVSKSVEPFSHLLSPDRSRSAELRGTKSWGQGGSFPLKPPVIDTNDQYGRILISRLQIEVRRRPPRKGTALFSEYLATWRPRVDPVGLDGVDVQVLPREAIVTQLAVFLDERTRPHLSLAQLKMLQVVPLSPNP